VVIYANNNNEFGGEIWSSYVLFLYLTTRCSESSLGRQIALRD
jgi:hypothetical protein